MWYLIVTVVPRCLAMGLGLSNAVTSFVPVIDLNWDLQALYPSGELLNIFLFFISQPESDFIVCTQDLLLPPTSTTRHCRYHHFHQSQEQTAIELAPRSSPDTVAIHITIFVTSSFNLAMELYLSGFRAGNGNTPLVFLQEGI